MSYSKMCIIGSNFLYLFFGEFLWEYPWLHHSFLSLMLTIFMEWMIWVLIKIKVMLVRVHHTGHSSKFKYVCCMLCRPRRSRVNMLASRPKVCRFKPDWGRWMFSWRKNPEHNSSGRDFKLWVPSLRFQTR